MTLMFEPLPRPTFRQGVAQRIAPFPKPALLGVSPYLSDTGFAEIAIDILTVPQQTPDLCLADPAISALHVPPVSPEVVSLTSWFVGQQLELPTIESLFVPLKQTAKAGKCYEEQERPAEQPIAFPVDPDEHCKHDLRKSQCSICSGQQRKAKAKPPHPVDVFDLIYPILMPPLGENLDSPLIFLDHRPYDFQREGIRFLAERQAALLGDEMGLGKTIQAITATRLLIRNGTIKSALVLCPKAVLRNWEKEFETWAVELRVNVVSGAKECRQALWKTPAHVCLVTYDTWREDHADNDIPPFDLCILDEAQRIKNPGTATTQAVRKIQAKYRWGLSGTPLENRLEDLISIFEFIKPGLFRTFGALHQAKERIRPYFLRRRKVDVLQDLPEKRRDDIWLEMEPAQRQAYERAEKEGIVAISEKGDFATVQHVLALISKLKQICNLDLESSESCKLDYLLDQLDEIGERGDKALVFSQFPEQTLKHLEPRLKQFGPLTYHGGLTDSHRNDILSRFRDDESCKVLLISTRAGGLGLNLTEANHVFHFDLWWNPATAAQAEDRAHRIGQRKGVFVQSLLTRDTIEERIQQILEQKGLLFKYFVDDLSETDVKDALSEEELFGLFGLQKPSGRSPGIASPKVNGQMSLDALSPEAFEKLVGSLYEKMGYKVKITPLTNDGGVDLYALRDSDAGRQRLAIQCKHYPGGPVDVAIAREMVGVLSVQPDITKGVIVTSGSFTSGCADLSSKHRIELVDRTRLLGLFIRYGISIN